MLPFDHIRKVVEGQKIVRIERIFFDTIGMPDHSEVQLELNNGVILGLTSTGVTVSNVPIAESVLPSGIIAGLKG